MDPPPPCQPFCADSRGFTFTFTDNGPQTGFSERTARCQRRRRRRSRREFMASLSRTGVSRTFGRHAIHSRTKNRLLAGQNKSGRQSSFPLPRPIDFSDSMNYEAPHKSLPELCSFALSIRGESVCVWQTIELSARRGLEAFRSALIHWHFVNGRKDVGCGPLAFEFRYGDVRGWEFC